VAEEVLDNLGEGQVARQEAAHQLIYHANQQKFKKTIF